MPIVLSGNGGIDSPSYRQDGDPVVESGSNSDGNWTKWADGTIRVQSITRSGSSNRVTGTLPTPLVVGPGSYRFSTNSTTLDDGREVTKTSPASCYVQHIRTGYSGMGNYDGGVYSSTDGTIGDRFFIGWTGPSSDTQYCDLTAFGRWK